MKNCFFISAIAVMCIVACKKPVDVIGNNTVATGTGYYPVSTNALQDVTGAPVANLGTVVFGGGYSFKTELQFFSQDPVKEINLYNTIGSGARTKVTTFPYAPAYSNIKKLDTLLVPYTVPAGLAAATSIKLEYEILNQNSLNVIRTVTIKTK